MLLPNPGPLERLNLPVARAAGVRLFCKRDDLFSPAPGTALQGNKVRKLSSVLQAAVSARESPLLVSFGGAYSNHLSALATAGRLYGLQVVVYVRGEEVDNRLLRQAETDGAILIRLSRSEYRRKSDEYWLRGKRQQLAVQFGKLPPQIWFIPEGGTSAQAVRSVSQVYREIVIQLGGIPDTLAVSAGTGGTAAGVILGANPATKVEVFPALKGDWMEAEIRKWLPENHAVQWSCFTGYTFGGYGKFPVEWIGPATGLAKRATIGPALPPLEPIYTAKLFFGVVDRLKKKSYPRGSTVVLLHTGGIY